jgi:hypothetical protein
MQIYNLSWVTRNGFDFVGKPKPDPSVLTITRESKRIANIIPEEKVSHMLSIQDHLQFHYTYDYQFVGI